MNWKNTENRTGLSDGSFRSVKGYSGESLVVARALLSGYNVFVKAWRDSPYDAVIDVAGFPVRVEIKQTMYPNNLSVTSGQRSGKMINPDVPQRTRLPSRDEFDVFIGVHIYTGKCWIVPTEFLEILGQKSVTTSKLDAFVESWDLFIVAHKPFPGYGLTTRLRSCTLGELKAIGQKLGLKDGVKWIGANSRKPFLVRSYRDRWVIAIWEELGARGKRHVD